MFGSPCIVSLIFLTVHVVTVATQTRTATTQPAATAADCICKQEDSVCRCTFIVEHKLTMVLEEEKKLVYVENGVLKFSENNTLLTEEQQKRVIVADGANSRLVIAINGVFPGPRIEVHEDQLLELTVINTFHTDSITVHFHGLHQRNSPWMDGVAYVTQCPILPGGTFVYRFTAYPPGTNMYHAHIGDQRSMGLYGALIVRPKSLATVGVQEEEIVVALQDWNHLMDAETAYHRMITEQFDLNTGKVIDTTYSVDDGQFSRFEFQSGLVNGKGRYWKTATTHNGAPLERFIIEPGTNYRFRVIGAMTLYPMRVYIRGDAISLRSSDAFNIEAYSVQSIIVHPGERYDFTWRAPGQSQNKEFFLVAETIETRGSHGKYHAAEAVLEIVPHSGARNDNPINDKYELDCTAIKPCKVFNCPYAYYPINEYRECTGFDDVFNIDPARELEPVLGNTVDEEYFFNFAFPGPPGSPGSVNGRGFIPPTGSLLTQKDAGITPCDESECSAKGICDCTYIQHIGKQKLVQMVFLNLGSGSGWSHPIHLHGHSFYLMKMGLGTYNQTSGKLIRNSEDINCTDGFGYCSTSSWANASWAGGNVPGMNEKPPEKDTIVVPTGGYVVIRFISDNPGKWFLHCHIDLHNTNGMGMVIAEEGQIPEAPTGFPVCNDFRYSFQDESYIRTVTKYIEKTGFKIATFVLIAVVAVFIVIDILYIVYTKVKQRRQGG